MGHLKRILMEAWAPHRLDELEKEPDECEGDEFGDDDADEELLRGDSLEVSEEKDSLWGQELQALGESSGQEQRVEESGDYWGDGSSGLLNNDEAPAAPADAQVEGPEDSSSVKNHEAPAAPADVQAEGPEDSSLVKNHEAPAAPADVVDISDDDGGPTEPIPPRNDPIELIKKRLEKAKEQKTKFRRDAPDTASSCADPSRMETQCGFDVMAYVKEWDAPTVLVEDSQPPFQSNPLEPAVEPKATVEAVTNQPETVPEDLPELAKSTVTLTEIKSTEEAVANQPATVPEALPKLAKSMRSVKANEASVSNQSAVEAENSEVLCADPKATEEARADPSTAKCEDSAPLCADPKASEEAHSDPSTAKCEDSAPLCVDPKASEEAQSDPSTAKGPVETAPPKKSKTSPKALPDPPVTKLPALTRGTPLLLSEPLQSKADVYQEAEAQVVTTKQDQDAMMAAVQKEQPKVGPKRGRGRGRGGPAKGEQETGRGRATGRGRGGRGRGGRGAGKPEEPKAEETPSVNGERPKKKAKVAAEGKATKDQKSEETPSAKKKPAKASAANASIAVVISVANKKATLAQNIKYAVMMAAVLEPSEGEVTPEVQANLAQMKMDFLGMDD
ncbi:unnamed protein product, partial [Symbiodinium necroappetens]